MRTSTPPTLTETPDTATNRPVGTACHLALLVLLLATTSNSYAEINFTKIGDPVFESFGARDGVGTGPFA